MTEKEKTKSVTGISACHREQGYSANQRPYSLIMKSNKELPEELITTDLIKALKHVTVELTFEDFLKKFFYLYQSDAELLSKLLGYETNLEIEAIENPDDQWLQDYNERIQDYLDEQLESITLLKSAVLGEKTLTLKEELELIPIQEQFEKSCKASNVTFIDEPEVITEEGLQKETIVVMKSNKDKENSVSTDILKSQKENPEMTDKVQLESVDIKKTKEYLDLEAELIELKKAREDGLKATFITKSKELSFLQETDQELLATALVKSNLGDKETHNILLMLIEKSNEALTAKDETIAELKKSFTETEHGKDGTVKVDTDLQNAQAVIDAKIEKAKKEREAK